MALANPSFLKNASGGKNFFLTWLPPEKIQAVVLCFPPLLEEMGRCRHAMSVFSRRLALIGFLSVQIDLQGCGDSTGCISQINLTEWLSDIQMGWHWLQERYAHLPCFFWSVRGGFLLFQHWQTKQATDCVANLNDRHFSWDPIQSGEHLRHIWAREIRSKQVMQHRALKFKADSKHTLASALGISEVLYQSLVAEPAQHFLSHSFQSTSLPAYWQGIEQEVLPEHLFQDSMGWLQHQLHLSNALSVI